MLLFQALRIARDEENRGGGAKPFLIAPALLGKRLVLQSLFANVAGKTLGVLRPGEGELGNGRLTVQNSPPGF